MGEDKAAPGAPTAPPDEREIREGRAAQPEAGAGDASGRIGRAVPAWAREALSTLEAAGHEAFVVGGLVRDALLGAAPHDVDIATRAPWEEVARAFRAQGAEVVETGTQHGTVTVMQRDAQGRTHPIEVTTYRVDGPYSDGRHPDEVRFVTSIEDDLSRRDFTVNAMAWNPERGLVDPFGGQADLAAGVIRAVGEPERRFSEDGLRVLRALRFASRLGFSIEPATEAAVESCAPYLDRVSAERIGEEYDGIVCGAHAVPVLRDHAAIVARILPETKAMMGFDQHSRWHTFDVWEHCLHALGYLPPEAGRIVRHATLLHDIGKPECFTCDESGRGHFYGHEQAGAITARSAFRRLRWRSLDIDHACLLIRVHDRHIEPTRRGVLRMMARMGRAYAGADDIVVDLFRELLQLKRADTLAHAPSAVHARLAQIDELEAAFDEVMAGDAVFRIRDLDISGRDIMALGVPRGPEVGRVLRRLVDAVIDGEVPNERAALRRRAREIASEGE